MNKQQLRFSFCSFLLVAHTAMSEHWEERDSPTWHESNRLRYHQDLWDLASWFARKSLVFIPSKTWNREVIGNWDPLFSTRDRFFSSSNLFRWLSFLCFSIFRMHYGMFTRCRPYTPHLLSLAWWNFRLTFLRNFFSKESFTPLGKGASMMRFNNKWKKHQASEARREK
jgi:hypothetical protein